MTISNTRELQEAIIQLEKKKIEQEKIMVQQFHTLQESLSPVNMLKNTINRITHETDIRQTILKAATGLGFGILTKKLFLGKSPGFVKKLLGNAMEVGVAKTAISHTDQIKAYGTAIYHNLFKKKFSGNGHTEADQRINL